MYDCAMSGKYKKKKKSKDPSSAAAAAAAANRNSRMHLFQRFHRRAGGRITTRAAAAPPLKGITDTSTGWVQSSLPHPDTCSQALSDNDKNHESDDTDDQQEQQLSFRQRLRRGRRKDVLQQQQQQQQTPIKNLPQQQQQQQRHRRPNIPATAETKASRHSRPSSLSSPTTPPPTNKPRALRLFPFANTTTSTCSPENRSKGGSMTERTVVTDNTNSTTTTTTTTTTVSPLSKEEEEQQQQQKTPPPPPTIATTTSIAQAVAALDQQGNALFEQGKYDEAFEQYQQALLLKRKALHQQQQQQQQKQQHASHSNTASSNTSSSSNSSNNYNNNNKDAVLASMATSINNMTYLKQRSGQASMEETMASYLKSLQIKRDILGPTHLSVGKTLNNIGSVFYLQQDYTAALKAYQDAHTIMVQQLGEDHLDVGTVRSNMGDAYAAMRNHKSAALAEYRHALNIRWNALGKRDPKVIRLMEQIARLETGEQPLLPGDEDFSEREGEDFMQKEEDAYFQDSCRTLQIELQEDLKYFDLVERQMAIAFIRDKTQMLRDMRDIGRSTTNDVDDNDNDVVSNGEEQTKSGDNGEPTNNPEGKMPARAESTLGKQSTVSTRDAEMLSPKSKGQRGSSKSPTSVANETSESIAVDVKRTLDSSKFVLPEQQEPVGVDLSDPSKSAAASTSGATTEKMIPETLMKDLQKPTIAAMKPSGYSQQPKKALSQEERTKALESVRERLERLRASRTQQATAAAATAAAVNSTTTRTTNTTTATRSRAAAAAAATRMPPASTTKHCKSYMRSTASSAAKVTTAAAGGVVSANKVMGSSAP